MENDKGAGGGAGAGAIGCGMNKDGLRVLGGSGLAPSALPLFRLSRAAEEDDMVDVKVGGLGGAAEEGEDLGAGFGTEGIESHGSSSQGSTGLGAPFVPLEE